jgi:aryl-alcohol dehydrogenase-like predicted oxidoreductase
MQEPLEKLDIDHVETFFLHSPDLDTSLEDIMEAVQELHRARKFKKYNLSNFNAVGLQQLYDLASVKGYVLHIVFQGNYSVTV